MSEQETNQAVTAGLIGKPRVHLGVPPNLPDYDSARNSFSWDAVRRELDGLPGGGLNIAHEAVDRHAAGALRQTVAIRWLDKARVAHDYTYADLAHATARFANVLANVGVRRGEGVFSLLERIPELYFVALGTMKYGAVFCPLLSAFGPGPVKARLAIGRARVLVTTPRLYESKVKPLRATLTDLEHIFLIGDAPNGRPSGGLLDLRPLLREASPEFEIAPTEAHDAALVHFTSGTTGAPKGAVHVHGAVMGHYASARLALDLRPGDIFWCTADPGWITGTSYGIIAPLTVGATLLVDQENFDAGRWWNILEEQRVSIWYTAPTAVRMLMKLAPRPPGHASLPALRLAATVGEPLGADAVSWGVDAIGHPLHDTWWQTETGSIMIANTRAQAIKPGSMGRPLPGVEAAIVGRTDEGSVEVLERPDAAGELALRAGWPSMFRGYVGDPAQYQKCFADGWYLSGDLARRDADGYFWFLGRADDAIKCAGHLIGPFEVESALQEHPAVCEAAVVGKPDPVVSEVVKAYVTLAPGYSTGEGLRREILAHARRRLGAVAAPKEIEFLNELPRTASGKILRRALRATEAQQPPGDPSTLSDDP